MATEALTILFRSLGGCSAVGRLLGRDDSTANRWLSGAMPIPAKVAEELFRHAQYNASRLIEAAMELKRVHIPAGERRAEAARLARRERFKARFGYYPLKSEWPR